jgi:hypothetical protein
MKNTELRIGNHVLFAENGIEFIIDLIDETGLLVHNEIEETWIELDAFNGISLTEALLLEFGFEFYGDGYENDETFKVYKNGINIAVSESFHLLVLIDEDTYYNFRWTEIKYAHQLQNLYFALTNRELKRIKHDN